MKILSIDPGETTGYAFVEVSFKNHITIIAHGEVSYPEGIRELIHSAFFEEADVVIVEDFIIRRPLIGDKAIASKIIGAFEVNVKESQLVLQQPSEKQRAPDRLFSRYGMERTSSNHVDDALRHIIVFIQKQS